MSAAVVWRDVLRHRVLRFHDLRFSSWWLGAYHTYPLWSGYITIDLYLNRSLSHQLQFAHFHLLGRLRVEDASFLEADSLIFWLMNGFQRFEPLGTMAHTNRLILELLLWFAYFTRFTGVWVSQTFKPFRIAHKRSHTLTSRKRFDARTPW